MVDPWGTKKDCTARVWRKKVLAACTSSENESIRGNDFADSANRMSTETKYFVNDAV